MHASPYFRMLEVGLWAYTCPYFLPPKHVPLDAFLDDIQSKAYGAYAIGYLGIFELKLCGNCR